MPQTPGSSIFRAISLAYGALFVLATACLLGAYWFWPGAIAWIFLLLGALALAGGFALTQLLARFRMLLWLLPYLGRLRTMRIARLGGSGDKAGREPNGR
jgi:hypothetical protein